MLPTLSAQAGPQVTLAGSNFEIDVDANLTVENASPSQDWITVGDSQKFEEHVGTLDEAFGQGSKEDTPVPTRVTGSIPPNKSDLKGFGTYLETTAAGRFMHMWWTRVQDPQGTTNMDFEFNKSTTLLPISLVPVRTRGDKLIQYDLENGGSEATLWVSTWLTAPTDTGLPCEASNSYPCWGERVNLTTSGLATGSINDTAIADAASDIGSGGLDPRTFGEASVDFDAIAGTGCNSFGSVYLKSRSSDSFSAALKDYIPPLSLGTTCGTLNITKQDDSFVAGTPDTPAALLPGVVFTLYNNVAPTGGSRDIAAPELDAITNPALTCTTGDGTGGTDLGKCSISDIPLGDYWVVETTPSGYAASPDQAVSITSSTAVPVTFTNPRLFKVIVLVCKQADNSLYASNVTLPSGSAVPAATKRSLSGGTPAAQAALCALGGAEYVDLQKGVKTVDVNIGTLPVPVP